MIYWLYEFLVVYDFPGVGMLPGITFRAGAAILFYILVCVPGKGFEPM